VISLTRCILEGGGDIASFQQRVIVKDFFSCCARGEQIKYIPDADPE